VSWAGGNRLMILLTAVEDAACSGTAAFLEKGVGLHDGRDTE
jgi:hypothetical protein